MIVVNSVSTQALLDTPEPARVLPSLVECQQARKSRDPRFEGRFIIGVVTTGIYCKNTCPVRMPAEANVRYFATTAAAQLAGFRPCRRCRPESAQSLPEWTISCDTVMRGLRLIEAGYLNQHTSAQLAQTLQIGERHLNRLFNQELGATPKMVARISRAKIAKSLLLESKFKLTEVALHAGYNSLSRFNADIKSIFKQTPTEIRAKARTDEPLVTLTLPVRLPYNFDWIFGYLQTRQLPGVEEVRGGPGEWCYRRRVSENSWVLVTHTADALILQVPLTELPIHSILHRIRRIFDLGADGETIHEYLSNLDFFKPWVQQAPGLRVAGAWDGFETSVRAVLGQQVSVARGTELANKMIQQYGGGLFPTPQILAQKEIAELGMPGQRGRAISVMAQQVADDNLVLDECQDFDVAQNALQDIKGIGPWTANYIRMRVLRDPNAFPDNDWVVLKVLDVTAARARKHSLAWQPWRSYALMYLWYASSQNKQMNRKMKKQTKQTPKL